jgi:hypothetical protein
MPEELKQVLIRGDAVSAYRKERKTRKRKTQEGGFDEPSATGEIPLRSSNISNVRKMIGTMSGGSSGSSGSTSSSGSASQRGGAEGPTVGSGPLMVLQPPAPPKPPALIGGAARAAAGAQEIQTKPKPKLVLAPSSKKKSMKKLHLAPHTVNSSGKKHNYSNTRKIRFNLTDMKKRLKNAEQIIKESRELKIDEVKKILKDVKLLNSKSPEKTMTSEYEKILRNTYENYLLLRNCAL